MENKKYIELDEMDIMLRVPAGACALQLTVTMMDDNNKTYEVTRGVSTAELYKARQNFLEYIGDDYDDTYVLTEKGKEWLEELKKKETYDDVCDLSEME